MCKTEFRSDENNSSNQISETSQLSNTNGEISQQIPVNNKRPSILANKIGVINDK